MAQQGWGIASASGIYFCVAASAGYFTGSRKGSIVTGQ
jgi:hypothetical protein